MQPFFSYTGVKIVHDEILKEALERPSASAVQETQKRGLLQTFGAFLARFANFSARKPKATVDTSSPKGSPGRYT